jgi:hypothetical protein
VIVEREREEEQVRGQTATDRPAPAAASPLRSLAMAIGNQAFTAHVARQPMTASEEEEEIPANVTRVAENVIGLPLDKVAEELEKGAPPGRWPALRAKMAAATAGFDQVQLSMAGFAGQRWRDGKDNSYIALGLMDAMMAPDGFKNLRMAWGRSYGTLEQIANRSDPDRAAAVREKAMEPVLGGINLIPELEKEEDKTKILQIRQEGVEIEPDLWEACGDDPLAFAAVQQFRLGLEILRMATMSEQEAQDLVAGWIDRTVFDVTHLDADPNEAYPPSAADEGDALPPREDPPPPPPPEEPKFAPSPNPLPPPPPPPL